MNKSADATWENGYSEAFIGFVKRNITICIGTNVLKFSDLQTITFEISNLLNQRSTRTISSSLRGQLNLTQVDITNPGNGSKVRDVTIRYKNQSPGALYCGQQDILINRSVHKLVIILSVEEQNL